MSDFDQIYARVQEMNRDWRHAVQNIRNGQSESSPTLQTVKIVDQYDGTEFGTVTIDDRGALRSIELEPYEVSNSYEDHILNSIMMTINNAIEQVRSAGTIGGRR